MKIVVANSVGRLENGNNVVLFPSRWDCNTKAGKAFAYYPYELAYLSALLKRDTKHEVKMIDGNMPIPNRVSYGWNHEEYAQALLEEKPDLIVTECSALTVGDMYKACRPCQVNGAKLWLTGPYGTMNRDAALEMGWDQVFAGEYEKKVFDSLEKPAIDNLPIDIDWLPWPEDDDISRIDYWEYSNPIGNRAGLVQMYPTRGCPLSCTFCAVPLYYGGHGNVSKSHRCRDVDDVCDEIAWMATRYRDKFKGCFFNEETHNANRGWFRSFCEKLIARELNGYMYDAMCGYWPFTEDLVKLASHAGYRQFRVGIENLSEASGKAIKKNVNQLALENFLEWCYDSGIFVYGTFQIGAPGSTQESDLETMAVARKWRREGRMRTWQCSISTPQPGTPFYAEAKEKGWLITDDLLRYNGVEPVVSYPHYSAEDIRTTRDMVCQT